MGTSPQRPRRVHRVVNVVLIIGSALFAALMLLTQALQLLGHFHPRSSLDPPTSEGERLGASFARTLIVGWSLATLIAGPVLVYGLLAKRPWAARWASQYWFLSLFSCYFTLPAIYGLFSTTRVTFRQLFEKEA